MLLADPHAPIASPWSTGSLHRIALADMLGVRFDDVSRADAMRVPSVVRARGLICGHLARLPLSLWRDDPSGNSDLDVNLPTPRWLQSTNTLQSPRSRLLWTADDLLFTGLSLWILDREPDSGEILDAIRVPRHEWNVDADSLSVQIRGITVTNPDEVCLIEGYQEGLCSIAANEIRGALDMSSAWQQRVASPVPLVELHQVDPNDQLDDDEIDAAIGDWESARRLGGTAFTPSSIQAIMHGSAATDLYIEGRNAGRLDIANFLQVPASLLEGSMTNSTLTYMTRSGERSDFLATCLAYWSAPIEARLSQDDVTPEGTSIRFDFGELIDLPPDTTIAVTED